MTLEFVERLPSYEEEVSERWLVRAPGATAPHVIALIAQDDPDWIDRVEAATRPWIGFAHPSIARVRSVERANGRLVIETDDDRGPSLGQAIGHLADVPADRARWGLDELCRVADGLAAMARHQPGFLHRRIGPPWMVVGPDGRVRLRPPIAHVGRGPRPAQMGAGKLSPGIAWLSPEQLAGVPVPPASDVFQLALTLYAAISGRHPYPSEREMDRIAGILRGDPAVPLAEAPPALATVIERGLATSRTERYPDVAAFTAALRALPVTEDAVAARARLAAWWPTAPRPDARSVPFHGMTCKRRWAELSATEHPEIRHCASCAQPVIQVRSIAAAVPLIGTRCVSFADEN
jgi:hypothetical protein